MFKIDGSKDYKVTFVFSGTSKNGDYTFITAEDELRKGQKFPDKLKINVWGENLSNEVKVGDLIAISGARETGIVNQQDKNDKNKWYQNLTISCNPENIIYKGTAVPQKFEPISDDQLPF